MTRLEFFLITAAHIERAEPSFRGMYKVAGLLLRLACERGYELDQLMMPGDISAMITAVHSRVVHYAGRPYPYGGLHSTKHPADAATYFLSVWYWLEAGGHKPSLMPLLEATVEPFARAPYAS